MSKILLTLSVLLLLEKSFRCYGEPNKLVEASVKDSHDVSDQGINIKLRIDDDSNDVSNTGGQDGFSRSEGLSVHITNIIFKFADESDPASKANDVDLDLSIETEASSSEEFSPSEENHNKHSNKKSHKKLDHSKEKTPHYLEKYEEGSGKDNSSLDSAVAQITTTPETKTPVSTTTPSYTTNERTSTDEIWMDSDEEDITSYNSQSVVVVSTSIGGAPPDVKVFTSNGTVMSSNVTVLPANFTALPPNFTVLPPNFTVLPPKFTVLPPKFTVLPPDFSVLPPKFTVLPPDFSVLPPNFGEGLTNMLGTLFRKKSREQAEKWANI